MNHCSETHTNSIRSMPIIPNEKVSPGLDPYAVSTFKFEMSEDESGALMNLAEVSYIPYYGPFECKHCFTVQF